MLLFSIDFILSISSSSMLSNFELLEESPDLGTGSYTEYWGGFFIFIEFTDLPVKGTSGSCIIFKNIYNAEKLYNLIL